MTFRALPLAALVLLAGCYDQPVANGYGSTTPRIERVGQDNSTLADAVTAVRVGELGPNFAACNAQGQVRERAADGPIPVRAAPFEQARRTGSLGTGATFFICSRSLDQRWLGVVFEASGRASPACGVSIPAPSRKDYEGPCDSGWVSSAQVRLISGIQPPPDQSSGNIAEAN